MEAVSTSEKSVYSNETTRYYITESSSLHTRRRENRKSRKELLDCATFPSSVLKE